MHLPTGFLLLSPQVRQCCLQFTNVVSHVVHADDGDADGEVGGNFTVMTIMVMVLVLVLRYLIQQ